jgi:hypothetical protein
MSLCGTDVPEKIAKSAVAAHMGSQVIDRKEAGEFVVIVNDNQPVDAVCCQNVSSLGQDIVLVAANGLGGHDVLDLSDVRILTLADSTNHDVAVRDYADDDI